MAEINQTSSPLEAAAGAATSHVIDAFKLLSNETRLAILLVLWEAYDPFTADNAVSFSELYDRVSIRDSGNFTYHLDKLAGHFVEETDDGYRLREAGLKLVQAVIAGTGLQETTMEPTEIDRSCHRCGAPVELSYENEHLHHVCTECEGNIGPNSTERAPPGTLMKHDFNPAGLTHRTPEDVFVAGSIEFLRDAGLLIRGVCPECSGSVDESLRICKTHEIAPGEVCPACGTRDEVRVSYVCSVCKHGSSFPVEAAVHDHPAVVAFRYEHGIKQTYDLDDPGPCSRMWAHLMAYEHTLASENPLRIHVSAPSDREVLRLILDKDLNVIDVTEKNRDTPEDVSASVISDVQSCVRKIGSETSADEVIPPNKVDCFEYLRRQRWPNDVTCPHCDSPDTIKKGTTRKGAQRYRCRNCDSVFDDLTGTIFAEHRLSLPEMFYIIQEMNTKETTQIARELDRSYKSVLNFVHDVYDTLR